jgi:hypothetical protein
MAYEINININNVGGEQQEPEGVSKQPTNTEQQKAVKALGKYVSAQVVQPFIQTVRNNVTQNIQVVTGNADLQQRVNFAFEVGQYALSTYQNAQAGVALGTSLGIGGLAGAGIGVALSVVNKAIEIGSNQMQIDLQSRIENYNLQQVRERSGVMYNRSRR